MTKQNKFVLAVALQVVIILGIALFKLLVLFGGTEIILSIKPVDPRDMLRGDYVTFNYDISDMNSFEPTGPRIKNGDTVFVILRESGGVWFGQNVQLAKPSYGEVFIRGKVESGALEEWGADPTDMYNNRVHIKYGIEDYFIPEGTGQNFSFFGKAAKARVVVDDNGNAVIKQILVDGKVWQ